MKTDFGDNLREVMRRFGHDKQASFAEVLGVSRATVNRALNEKHTPSPQFLRKLAEYVGVPEKSLFLAPSAFSDRLDGRGIISPSMKLETVAKQRDSISEIRNKYVGEFNLYTQRTSHEETFGSYLRIYFGDHVYPEFRLINPYLDVTKRHSCFEYSGVAIFTFGTLYLVGTEDSHKDGLLNITFLSSKITPANVLEGMIGGVGIFKESEITHLAATPAVAIRRQRRLEDWRQEVGDTLGVVNVGSLPSFVPKMLGKNYLLVPDDRK